MEKKRKEIVDVLISEVNKTIKLFPLSQIKYDRSLLKIDISIEKKKELLLNQLHEAIVKTFSIKKVAADKRTISILKNNLSIIRKIIDKLSDINYYLETIFLEEIGLLKSKRKKGVKRLIESKFPIDKKEFKRIEHTVYALIERIIFLDNRLLKKFRKREEGVVEEERLDIHDIENVLKKETELLLHLDAKTPPPNKLRKQLLNKLLFDHWAARVLALLAAIEYQFHQESKILKRLKNDQKVKSKIEIKIKHIMKEKKQALALKEARIVSAERLRSMDNEWRKAIHNWDSASKL